MNEPTRSRALSRCRCALACSAGAIVALSGCAKSPFQTYEDDLGPRVSLSRLRQVDRFGAEQYLAPPDQQNPQIGETPVVPDVFAGLDRVDVTIEQARAWTLANNLSLQATLIDPAIANQRITAEEGAFDTVIFANASYGKTDQPTATQLEGSQIENATFTPGVRIPLRSGGTITFDLPMDRVDTNNQFSTLNPAFEVDGRFSISQPLLRNAGRRVATYGIRVAALNQQISEARTKLEVIRQLADADRAYWRLYAAQEALDVRRLQYDLAREQLETSRRRVDAGDLPEVEVTRAESGLASTLEQITGAQNLIAERERELKRVMNAPGLDIATATYLVPETAPDPVRYDFDYADLADRAVEHRMELLELELQLAIDESTIALRKNATLPLFTLDYSAVTNGLGDSWSGASGQAGDLDYIDHFVRAQFEMPLGNQTANANLREAVLLRVQRLSTREARRQSIREETLNAADRVRAAWGRILASRLSVITATRTLDAERRQFDVGARTSTDVLNASTDLADARLIEIQALTDYQIALVDLAFATGTTLGAARVNWAPIDPTDSPPPDFPSEQENAILGLRLPTKSE
ncbi:MAG: TolC family protein [Phycisphaerales bacterium]